MLIFPTSDHGIASPAYRSAKWSFLLQGLGPIEVPEIEAQVQPSGAAGTAR
jgi:hypothetical protein